MRIKKLMRTPSESAAGFTLIELMIVVAIIGILASIAIPNFLKAREKARFTQCVEAMKGVQVAMEMFVSDNGSYDMTCDGDCAGHNDPDSLAMYMIAGCTARDGNDCAGEVQMRMDRNCDNFAIVEDASYYDYELHGDAKERFKCQICVSPAGYNPENYADCVNRDPYTCP